MSKRVISEAQAGIERVDAAVDESGLPLDLLELVRLHASRLNGCAYCIDMHEKDLRALGRGDLAPADDRERAALAWAEELTLRPAQATPDRRTELLGEAFSTRDQVALTLAISATNAWNRFAGPLGAPVGDYVSRFARDPAAAS